METRKIILSVLILILFSGKCFSQAEYVPFDNPVYSFLERMNSKGIITKYDSFQRIKTRSSVAALLTQISEKKTALSGIENQMLEDFLTEFEFDINKSVQRSQSLLGEGKYDAFSQQQRYLFFYTDPANFNIFSNFTLDIYAAANKVNEDNSKSAAFVRYGGFIRGTVLEHLGFYMKATNGRYWGDKTTADKIEDLKFNYKFNQDPDLQTATEYFDDTEGYLSLDYDVCKVKIGRDRNIIGYGPVKTIISQNIPKFDYLSFDLNYKNFSFSYFHGKLLSQPKYVVDSIEGLITTIPDKFLAFHRFAYSPFDNLTLGAGEMIIYANRTVDMSYLNPFNFYKSVEHANQDRDNSMIFFDASYRPFAGLKINGTLLFDDIDFMKFGSNWYGNMFMYDISSQYSFELLDFPADLTAQYIRMDPYTYTHRISYNNYSNFTFSLANPLKPNSDLMHAELFLRPHYRLLLSACFQYQRHGANIYDAGGRLIRNVGGEIMQGHREEDNKDAKFLDGAVEHNRYMRVKFEYEVLNDYYISGALEYISPYKDIFTTLKINLRY